MQRSISDAVTQIRATTGALAARLLRAIEWAKETKETIEDASEKLGEGCDPHQREARLLRQREESDMIEQPLAWIS